jgi:GTPase SAR1 family protein
MKTDYTSTVLRTVHGKYTDSYRKTSTVNYSTKIRI